jgi:hypothetical protein
MKRDTDELRAGVLETSGQRFFSLVDVPRAARGPSFFFRLGTGSASERGTAAAKPLDALLGSSPSSLQPFSSVAVGTTIARRPPAQIPASGTAAPGSHLGS